MRYAALSAFIALLAFSSAAHAQAYAPAPVTPTAPAAPTTQNFDQYPSYIQMSSQMPDGSEVVLRCGYTQNGITILADPAYMEMSVLSNGNYLRYQRIDNKLVVSVPAQEGVTRLLMEVVEPTGITIAKNCQSNNANDTIQGCVGAQPFMPAAQVQQQDQNAASQCGALLARATPQLNRTTYSAPKTDIFKNALRQKVGMLEAP